LAGLIRGGNRGPTIVDALGLALLRLTMLPADMPPATREMVQLAGQGALFANGGMKDAAEQAYTQLMARYADAPNVHYVYGSYLARDRPDQALDQFRLELKRSPDHVLARVRIAEELIKRGEIEQAAPMAREAVRIAPGNFVARKVLGQVKLQSGDVPGAIIELEAAVKLEPDSPSVHFTLARAYQRAGRSSDAARERTEFTRLERLQQIQRGGPNAVGDQPETQDNPLPQH
jgi:predicted Zn-dependent protease